LGYWTYHVISKNKAAAQVADDEQRARTLIAKSVGDNVVVVGPMADFYRDFQKSFKFALEKHWFVEL
jgi:Na+/H+-translocating membrane pyrophosphatase